MPELQTSVVVLRKDGRTDHIASVKCLKEPTSNEDRSKGRHDDRVGSRGFSRKKRRQSKKRFRLLKSCISALIL